MTRTTIKTLRSMVDSLNELTGNPTQVWKREGNRNVAHVGAFILDACYGGYRLSQIVSDGGGEHDLTPLLPAGQCANAIRAFERGLNYQAPKE